MVDLIAKILAWLFPESNGYRLRDVFSIPSVSLPGQAPDTTVSVLPPRIITAPAHPATPALPEIPAGKVPEGTMLNGASLCPQCHSLAYVQDGKCKSALLDPGRRRLRGINGNQIIPDQLFRAESGCCRVPPV